MKNYVVWSIYTPTGSHITDEIQARNEDRAMAKADKLPNRLSYKAIEVDNYEYGTLSNGGRNNSININEYNPN